MGCAFIVALALAVGSRPSVTGGRAAPAPASAALVALGRLERLPLPAQATISSTVAAASSAFRARRTASGYSLSGGGLTTSAERGTVRVSAGGAALSLSLVAVGRGPAERSVEITGPAARANRVIYARPGVEEWYAAGPLGLEQGFVVSRRPRGSAGLLTVELRIGGALEASRSGSGISFSTDGRAVLRYGGVAAVDARGRPLPARIVLRGDEVALRIGDAGARYPVRIDPFIQQSPKLTGDSNSQFGYSVALSGDGQTALVGAPDDTSMAGTAWVFARSGSTWSQQAEIGNCGDCVGGTGLDETLGGQLGDSVALSYNGSIALIGGPDDHSDAGAAWGFDRDNGTWSEAGSKLTGPAGSFFGASVALSMDGSTALIGAPEAGGDDGSVYVMTGSDGAFTQSGMPLTGGSEIGGGQFGRSVALSSAGDVALIGAPFDNDSEGAAWVFTNSGGWTQQAKLVGNCPGANCTGPNGTGEQDPGELGSSVALSSAGNIALLGAPDDNTDEGAAWVFANSNGWKQQGTKLVGDCPSSCSGPNGSGETDEGEFGSSVALSANGDTALIGGPKDDGGKGGVWAFDGTSGSDWNQQGAELIGDCTGCGDSNGSGESGAGDFGGSVAVAADSGTALIGGPDDSSGVGAAWVFAQPPSCSDVAANTPPGGGTVTVSLSCLGPPGAAVSYSTVSSPVEGVLGAIDQGNGTVTYTSEPGAIGTDSFTYQASDSGDGSNIATVTITILPAAPSCSNVAATAPAGGGAVTVSLACTAPPGAALSYSIVSGPSHGAVGAVGPTGSVTYASQSGYAGPDSFTYEASDAGGVSNSATATLTVPPPVLQPPQVSIVGTRNPLVGVSSSYSASVIDTSATISAYKWLVDGHVAGAGSSLSQKFTSGGNHSISLQVLDTAGQAGSASVKVDAGYRRLSITTPWNDSFTSSSTVFTSLVALAVPVSTQIQLTCTGAGCPFARHALSVSSSTACHSKKCKATKHGNPGTRTVDLGGLLAGSHLGVGTHLAIRFTLRFFVGQLVTFTITGSGPRRQTACLAPGAKTASHRC